MKTRRFFGWVAMATMVLSTGCSNDEVVENFSPENAIEFGTYVGRDAQSRASVFDESVMAGTTDNPGPGFGVFAYYSQSQYTEGSTFTANFMNNQQVTGTYNEETEDYDWTYSPLKYWPNNATDYVSFIAYAPWQENKTFNATYPGKIDFTVVDDVKSQTDLVWSNSATLNMQKQTIDGNVTFNFAHALSRIGFNLYLAVDDLGKGQGVLDEHTTIYVDKIELSNVFAKAGVLDLTKTTATWLLENTEWQGFTLDYVYENGAVNDQGTELQNNILTAPEEETEGEEDEETVENSNQLNKDDSYLMIIPRETTFVLTVTYRVFTEDSSLTGEVAEQSGVKGSLVTNVIPVEITTNFVAGNAYTYNIILGMTSVKVDVAVTPWSDVTATDHWFTPNTGTEDGTTGETGGEEGGQGDEGNE